MKIKDVVIKTALLLNREDIISFIERGYAVNSDLTKKDLSTFVTMSNFIINELATEYVPVKKWERQIVKEGKIYFDNFNYSVKEIEKILTLDGENLKFKVFSDYIKVDGDTVDVFYTCLPSLADLEEEIIYKESDLPLRMLAYGVARESCIIEGRFDEANQWQIKFERGIKSVVVPKKLKNVIIKERSFY